MKEDQGQMDKEVGKHDKREGEKKSSRVVYLAGRDRNKKSLCLI